MKKHSTGESDDSAAPQPEGKSLSKLMPKALLEAKQKLKTRLLLWASLVGILTGGVGTLFQVAVQQVILGREHLIELVKDYAVLNWLVPTVLSAVMVYFAFLLMRKVAPETGGSGIPQIEGFLNGLFPIRWQIVLPAKFLGGLLTLGSGMVLGREGPTIQMGGSIGKMVGSYFRSSGEQVKILVAAGAGAGLASAFNAPLAGILFVSEEMRPNFEDRISSYRAVTLASVMATIVVGIFLGQGADIKITKFEAPPLESLLGFAILGICLGVIGYFFNLSLFRTLDWFSSLRGMPYVLTGLYVGAAIGFLGWLYPPITGGGDETIFWAFKNEASSYVLLSLFLLRFALTMFSYGCGAPGGIFAPMLALATTFSMGATQQVHDWFELPFLLPEPNAFAVAGMGALVAATVRAPLTAIVLTIEMTDNYLLILPLLVTCLTSTITAHALGGEPIYSVLLKRNLSRTQINSQIDS
jgi:CIC family chloride channel protein